MFGAIVCTKKLKNETLNIIILSMTVAHFYSSFVIGATSQIGVLFGEEFFAGLPGKCLTIGSSCIVTCANGFLNSVLLTFNRQV